MNKKKYWIAIGEHAAFTRDDHYVFQVFFTGQGGSSGLGLTPKFIDADGLEEARAQLHAFVDERIDHEIHMVKLDVLGDKLHKKREAIKAIPTISDGDINSLSIGSVVNVDPKMVRSDTAGLLNLEELL